MRIGVETVPGQQRQLSADDHPFGQGELEQALEEPGELVHGRPRPSVVRHGTRPERGQREVATGERAGKRRARRDEPDLGHGRQISTLARGPLNRRRARPDNVKYYYIMCDI